ncbi:MAG: hypothetical protein ACP6IP_03985 [Candidatus Njordarchaeia archaeon]
MSDVLTLRSRLLEFLIITSSTSTNIVSITGDRPNIVSNSWSEVYAKWHYTKDLGSSGDNCG